MIDKIHNLGLKSAILEESIHNTYHIEIHVVVIGLWPVEFPWQLLLT